MDFPGVMQAVLIIATKLKMVNIQPWARAEHHYCSVYVYSAFHPPWEGKMSICFWVE